jgi:hypothetical protein
MVMDRARDRGPQKLTGAAHATLLTLQRQAAQDCV